MSAHTPGPWRIVDEFEGSFFITAGSDEDRTHCVIAERASWDHRASESAANGHLIAAAPDMKEALQALGAKPDGYCFCLNQEQVTAGHTGECRAAVAALTKAGA